MRAPLIVRACVRVRTEPRLLLRVEGDCLLANLAAPWPRPAGSTSGTTGTAGLPRPGGRGAAGGGGCGEGCCCGVNGMCCVCT
eukprot:6187817-Pleurochrysis_carterae.AAC.1